MATVNADIREIERTVYGRDMRKPLVDALTHLKNYYASEGIKIYIISDVTTTLLTDGYYRLNIFYTG